MKFRVATAKCDPIEQVWPGAPVIALLRAGRDPLTTTAEFEQITRMISEPLVLADQIASQLENAVSTGPLLLAIDDLQWADRISRFLVRALVSRLTGLPGGAWVGIFGLACLAALVAGAWLLIPPSLVHSVPSLLHKLPHPASA